MCLQPLPPRRWWHFIEPPPMHDPKKFPWCEKLFYRRLGI
jgi:hypothetical protein